MDFPMYYDKESLRKYNVSQLSSLASMFKLEISNASQHLVHSLVKKDGILKGILQLEKKLTDVLIQYASDNALDTNLQFNIDFTKYFDNVKYHKWLNAWTYVSRIGRGIPKRFRKKVWAVVANHHTRFIYWEHVIPILFHSKKNVRDVNWIHHINKTPYEIESKYVSHKSVEKVLLAYSRHNASAEFTTELCILSSLVLKVMEGEEEATLKVMVYLLDYNLPSSYFSNNLMMVTVDMAVLNDLLPFFCSQLPDHLQQLRKTNCSLISKFSLCENTINVEDYEPPLTNAFVLQWFLFLFTTCLSWKALRRMFDAIIIYGSDMLLYGAVSVWSIFEKDILNTKNVPDYFNKVAELVDKLKDSELISSSGYIMTVYSVYDLAQDIGLYIPELRQKHYFTHIVHSASLIGVVQPRANDTDDSVVQCFPSKHVMSVKAECPQIMTKNFTFANPYAADIPNTLIQYITTGISDDHIKLLKEGQTFKVDL